MRITPLPRLVAIWAVCHLFTASASAQDLVGLYLTWTQDPATTITVNWVEVDQREKVECLWHREAGTPDWKTSKKVTAQRVADSTLRVRRVELAGLKPDTRYEFGIGDPDAAPEEPWNFRTLPRELDRPVRFVSGGDMGTSSTAKQANRQAAKLDPDFAVLGGDLAYDNGFSVERWVLWLQSWKNDAVTTDRRILPFVIVIGNHEVKGGYDAKLPEDAPFFSSLFALPGGGTSYALDFGNYLSFVALDSGHSQKVEGAQTQWLKRALEERRGQRFLFPIYHFPAYGTTKAPKGQLPIDNPKAVVIRENWVPLFDRYGVSAVFENDHHTYKRTYPLRNDKRDDATGIIYLGDGAWGVNTREVPKPGETWWLAKAEKRNHLWHIELRPNGSLKCQAIDVEGVVFDELELSEPRTKLVE